MSLIEDFINKLTICTQIQKNKEILVNWVLTKSGMYTNKNCQEDIKKNEQVSLPRNLKYILKMRLKN